MDSSHIGYCVLRVCVCVSMMHMHDYILVIYQLRESIELVLNSCKTN